MVIQNNFGTQHVLQMLRASEKDLPVPGVIYQGVLTIEMLEEREFQFVYIFSLLSNTQFMV